MGGNAQSMIHRSIFGPEVVDNIQEDDSRERDADFYLFYRALEGMSKLSQSQPLAHWAVVVEYPDDPKRVFTFEAGVENKSNGTIIATRSQEYPSDREKGKFLKLGTKSISPKQLVDFAKEVSLNGKAYHLIVQNCQAWCKEFCRFISQDFLKDQFWDSKNFLAVCAAALVASGPIGVSVLGTAAVISQTEEKKD